MLEDDGTLSFSHGDVSGVIVQSTADFFVLALDLAGDGREEGIVRVREDTK